MVRVIRFIGVTGFMVGVLTLMLLLNLDSSSKTMQDGRGWRNRAEKFRETKEQWRICINHFAHVSSRAENNLRWNKNYAIRRINGKNIAMKMNGNNNVILFSILPSTTIRRRNPVMMKYVILALKSIDREGTEAKAIITETISMIV